MPDVKTKYDLILEQERQLARAIAHTAIQPQRLTVWDVMIPFVFIAGHLRLREKREHCVRNLLFTKTMALEAALSTARDGVSRTEAIRSADTKTRKVLASADEGIYSNAIRKQQMREIALLTDHYLRLLNASGNSCAALVRAAYRDKAALTRFLSGLRDAEQHVAQAAHQFLGERADTSMGHRIERNSAKIRHNWAHGIFDPVSSVNSDSTRHQQPSSAAGRTWRERLGQWFNPSGRRKRPSSHGQGAAPGKPRRWKLLQVEPALACNLGCIMCPWQENRQKFANGGIMTSETWASIHPHLPHIDAVDFTGGGEPLLQPLLVDWIHQAHRAGCQTGLLTNATLLTRDRASALVNAGIDWIGISMDGADAATYEQIRVGAQFDTVCRQVKALSAMRPGHRPKLMINFVLMRHNVHQLDRMVRLASDLGVDQLNFKQCDVIRGPRGRGLEVFGPDATRLIRRLESRLSNARRRAKKIGLQTTAFGFTPEPLPVCGQDPGSSMYVRHDGVVGPCISQVLGGPTTFLGQRANMPTCHYGCLADVDLRRLWEGDRCRSIRHAFHRRTQAYEAVYARRFIEGAAGRTQTEKEARRNLPPPPKGCEICHYLYNI